MTNRKNIENEHFPEILVEGGVRKAIFGYTWPGIEFGEPPSPPFTFFQYVDAVRFGDLSSFQHIEAACQDWWSPTMDRGAGALLHFAVDHGQFDMVKFLIDQRGVPVNQRCRATGWTPLHRCAFIAHYKHAPFLQIFEYLLSHGADPELKTLGDRHRPQPATALDLAVNKGYGWAVGQIREILSTLIDKYRHVQPKQPDYTYNGPMIGGRAHRVLHQWEALPKLYPPKNWRAPPLAGCMWPYCGMRRHSVYPWRPAGDNDGSFFTRPMTPEEVQSQSQGC